MHITAIVLAAGQGLRLKSRFSKPLIEINSKPIIIYCLQILNQQPDIKDIIVVANAKNLRGIADKVKKYHISKIKNIVLGGQARQDSVTCGLRCVDSRTDLVLIHDAVRPFIDKETVSSVIRAAGNTGAAIVGVPVKATIKETRQPLTASCGRLTVKKTLKRDNLWEIQTPQVFKKELILEAYRKFNNIDVTDDAMLVEKLGARVGIVLGSYANIKITTREDLIIAEAILNNRLYR